LQDRNVVEDKIPFSRESALHSRDILQAKLPAKGHL
jgi:hypothetical protein